MFFELTQAEIDSIDTKDDNKQFLTLAEES